jgi:salicylate hydroxylase
VLVGADGVRSRVTQRLTGRPAARPAGVTAIAGTVLLDEPSSPAVSAGLHKGLGFAIGPHGVGMFLAVHTPRPPAVNVDGAEPERPYLVWSVAARLETVLRRPRRHAGRQRDPHA